MGGKCVMGCAGTAFATASAKLHTLPGLQCRLLPGLHLKTGLIWLWLPTPDTGSLYCERRNQAQDAVKPIH